MPLLEVGLDVKEAGRRVRRVAGAADPRVDAAILHTCRARTYPCTLSSVKTMARVFDCSVAIVLHIM